MKKITKALALILIAGVGLTACGSTESSTKATSGSKDADTTVAATTADSKSSKEITEDSLLKHKASPESDFSYGGDESTGISIEGYLGHDEIVVIPDTIQGIKVVKINNYVFGVNSGVKAVKICDSITLVDENAFAANADLQIVLLGKNVKKLGHSAFLGCTSLKTLKLNEGLEEMDQFAIAGCTSLKTVEIPNSVITFEISAIFNNAKDFKLICSAGSEAEKYAKSEKIPYETK